MADNVFANDATAVRNRPSEAVMETNYRAIYEAQLLKKAERDEIRKILNKPDLSDEEADRIIEARRSMPQNASMGRPRQARLNQELINELHKKAVEENLNINNGLRLVGYSNMSDKAAELNPEQVQSNLLSFKNDAAGMALTTAALIPGMQWLRGFSPSLYHVANAGLTALSGYDWYENGPNFWNVSGTMLGGLDLGLPLASKGYFVTKNASRPYILANRMNSSLKSNYIPPELYPIRTDFNLGKNSGRVVRADKGDGKGAFTGTGSYTKDGYLYPGQTRKEGQRNFTWWNEDKIFSPGFRTNPFPRVFIANKSDIPGLQRVREMNEPVGLWRPGSKKAFVIKSEMVTPEPTDVTNLTLYNYDPNLRIYVRSDIPTHVKTDLVSKSYKTPNVAELKLESSVDNLLASKYLELLGNKKDINKFEGTVLDRSLVTRPFAEYLESLGIDSSLFTELDINNLMQMRSKSVQSSIPQTGRSAVVYETKPRNQLTIFSIDINENGNSLGEILARSHTPNHPRANEVPIDMILRIEGIPSRGLSEDAYNAAIDYIHLTGIGEGIVSGNRLLSPEITYKVWEHYPNRQILRNRGHHSFGTGRDINGSNIYETHEGPIVMLTEPSKTPVPMKSNHIFHPDMIKDGKLLFPDWTKRSIYYSLPLLLNGMYSNKETNYQ